MAQRRAELSTRAVDPARSRIVLLGTARYRDPELLDVPQIDANVDGLRQVFLDPDIGRFAEEHCRTVAEGASVADVGDLLEEAAEQAEDLLLLYYSGHGVLRPSGSCTSPSPALGGRTRRTAGCASTRSATRSWAAAPRTRR